MDSYDRLEQAMEQAGLARKVVAMVLKFNVSNFASWKKRRNLPDAEILVPLCRLCGVTVEQIVDPNWKPSDEWMHEHRQLIADLKVLRPESLKHWERGIHLEAEVEREEARNALGKSSASGQSGA